MEAKRERERERRGKVAKRFVRESFKMKAKAMC